MSSESGAARSTLLVDRTEAIQVSGISYSTFVVAQETTFLGYIKSRQCDLTYRRTIWYDPSLGIVVRDRMLWMTGQSPGIGWEYELVAVRPPVVTQATAEQLAEIRAKEQRLAQLIAEAETRARGLASLQGDRSAGSNLNVPSFINFGSYHALVIGINDYENLKPLKTAVADAEAIAEVLHGKYGFKVTKLINPSHEDILDALDELRETLKFKDNLLIYYAGHGWLDEKADEGYWLASNAKNNRRSRWVSNSAVTATLKALESKHVMVVSDSRFSGRLVRDATIRIENADDPEYLQKMSRKKARVVIASGGLEPVEDGKGLHSPFARAFLNALNENDGVIHGSTLFAAIRRPVMVNANQTPQYSDVRRAGHDGGEFLFVRRR